MKKLTLIFSILLIGIYGCQQNSSKIKLTNNIVTLSGKIENYKGIYDTGKFAYFDGVGRIPEEKVFKINKQGEFSFDIEIVHPLLNAYFDLEGQYYGNFLIEPNTKYHVTVKDGTMTFNGKTGEKTKQIRAFSKALNSKLGDKIKNAQNLHTKGLSIDAYIKARKQLESEKLNCLKDYAQKHPIDKQVYAIIENSIKLKTAHAIVNYRYDYSGGYPRPRKEMPHDFYTNLFRDYPVTNITDIVTRNGIDYVSNLASILTDKGQSLEKQIDFIKSANVLTRKELKLLVRVLGEDETVMGTPEFNQLRKEKGKVISDLYNRYLMNNLIDNAKAIKAPFFKDVVLAQGITECCIDEQTEPSAEDWKRIAQAISDKDILQYLKERLSKKGFAEMKKQEKVNQETKQASNNKSFKTVKAKYIDKYKGKIIYVDFYATWCGPCRAEIPFAKELHKKFEGKDIVFLNLCAASGKSAWEKLIKQYDLKGENYWLNNEDDKILNSYFNIKGYPTYLIIDRKGKVIENNTLRPSSRDELYKKLNQLLEKK